MGGAASGLRGLDLAVEALRAGDHPGFVAHVVAAEGGATARAASVAGGTGFVAVIAGAQVFVSLHGDTDELTIQAPIARLPADQRLPALRLALELCALDAAGSRIALRGELLLLRFSAPVARFTPAALRLMLREVGGLACRYAGLMCVAFNTVSPFEGRTEAPTFGELGEPKRITLLPAVSLRRSMPPPPSADRSNGDPLSSQGGRKGLSDRPARSDVVPARTDRGRYDDLPPPTFRNPAPAEHATRFPSARPPTSNRAAPSSRPPLSADPSGLTQLGLAPVVPGPPRSMSSDKHRLPTAAEIEFELAATSEPPISASDRLSALLRRARALSALLLEERPSTIPWLSRAMVFRAIYGFRDVLPDAIAFLYREGSIGDWTRTEPSTPPSADLLLPMIDRVITTRGQLNGESPLVVEPIVNAGHAKEVLARCLGELECAPRDPGLRHFLALGALSELLVRGKLHSSTDQRLRSIVEHADREGERGPVIELMVTAIRRISS